MEQLNLCAKTTEAVLYSPRTQLLSLGAAATEALGPRACSLQEEKPPQSEACTGHNGEKPLLAATRESPCVATKAQRNQN